MEVFAFVVSLFFVSASSALRINSIALPGDAVLVGAGPAPADSRCYLSKDAGTGEGQEGAWYYSADMGRCIFFVYFGKGGNENRFANRSECENACLPPPRHWCPELDCPETCTKELVNECEVCACTDEEAVEVCSQPMQKGKCRALYYRYGWNNGRCEEFVYGGCGGNQNNFETKETCMSVCGHM